MFMTMDYNMSDDTTILIPMKLDMYTQPETYYASDNKLIGQKYKYATKEFNGRSTEISHYTSLTDGKYNKLLCLKNSRLLLKVIDNKNIFYL